MADIVFINPSANMILISRQLKLRGISVVLANVEDIYSPSIDRVNYFLTDNYRSFEMNSQSDGKDSKKEERMFLFKPTIINKLRMLTVNMSLKRINNDLESGVFNDLVMYKSNMLFKSDLSNSEVVSFRYLSEVRKAYSTAKIFTKSINKDSDYKIFKYNSAFDYQTVLGRDYFVFFADKSRIEMYVSKGDLVIISKHDDPISIVKKLIPTVESYSFTVKSSSTIKISKSPYIEIISPDTFLFNDYSFGKTSIVLPSYYYDKVADFIVKLISKK